MPIQNVAVAAVVEHPVVEKTSITIKSPIIGTFL
jgi:hypothetical protein